MKKKLKGGIESIIATVIIVGIVVILIWVTVIPMSEQGDAVLTKGTNKLVDQQMTIGPGI